MSLEKVIEYLAPYGYGDKVRTFDSSSATVALAAQALGVREAMIAKTLSFLTKDGCVIVVAAGDARVNNGKFKAQFGEKARMLPHELVEEMTGHPVGGVCPFGVKGEVPVYLDISLKRFDIIYPAAGNDHSAVELTCDQLERASHARGWVDVCKDWVENTGEIQEKD